MTLVQGTILGLLQGLTEFLPVSSSGHLVIVQHYLGLRHPLLLFNIVLHTATLAAVLFYFRQDIIGIVVSLARFTQKEPQQILQRKLFYLILLGSVPIALVGGLFRRIVENLFANVPLASFLLLVTGTLLWTSERIKRSNKGIEKVGIVDTLLIGVMQAAAILPGISRSGGYHLSRAFSRSQQGIRLSLLFPPLYSCHSGSSLRRDKACGLGENSSR
ncbi:undecaprenyl-diphosphate phosphatase [Candidatus Aerophobetes bacterium]|uniref:Undecaprenyl-diphosphatase n=1 Tax=Aerophobetes bacterium TaxID=2030807 RepID=A0A523WBC0_UNCAE|nr:MAG: undecaprenyl-diphosphate phosphatase [Candidatus Aerophobetes bacterium]